MLTKKIHIPIYEYDVFLYVVEEVEDADAVIKALNKFGLQEIVREVRDNIIDEVDGGGVTCFNAGAKTAVTVIYPHSDADYYIATLDHEKRHIVDDVLEHCDVNDKEAAAYLSGWLTTKFKF